MGIRPFSKHHKSGSSKVAADNPPPVFNKHGDDDLLKGHKTGTSGKPTSAPTSSGSIQSATSSTSLWVAQANAAAKNNRNRRFSDEEILEEVVDDDFYEEEVVEEDFFEEEVVDESLPPRKITIRFDEYDEMQTILHINDYTKHEISRAWYKREDYDKMVSLARKTAEKVEERSKQLGKLDKKPSKKIEYRGLEAWTSMGAVKVKLLKESAVEAVWNEQSRQWDAGITDPEKIREVYVKVSRGAQAVAEDRGFSDALIAKRIRQLDLEEAEKKRKRKLLGKTKAVVKKSVKVTTGGVVKTAKLGVKTTKLTGKVALGAAKMTTKTAVATATLDRKMLKEAIIPEKKKRECEKQVLRRPSQATNATDGTDTSVASDADSLSTQAKKKKKLKLLGVVPIPGTQKTYREDRRQERIEKRMSSQSRRPAWEASVSQGKY